MQIAKQEYPSESLLVNTSDRKTQKFWTHHLEHSSLSSYKRLLGVKAVTGKEKQLGKCSVLNRQGQVRCSATKPWWWYKGRVGACSAEGQWWKAELCPQGAFMLLLPLLTLEKSRKMHISAVLNYCFNKLAWKLSIQSLKIVRVLTIAVGKPASTLSWGNRRSHERDTTPRLCMSNN